MTLVFSVASDEILLGSEIEVQGWSPYQHGHHPSNQDLPHDWNGVNHPPRVRTRLSSLQPLLLEELVSEEEEEEGEEEREEEEVEIAAVIVSAIANMVRLRLK